MVDRVVWLDLKGDDLPSRLNHQDINSLWVVAKIVAVATAAIIIVIIISILIITTLALVFALVFVVFALVFVPAAA